MSAKAEARDLAYRTWCECGQNLSETERRLNRDLGLPVTRQTLAEWREKYDWAGRAAKLEAECARQDKALSDDSLIAALLVQKERYEEYFKTLPFGQVDNQAVYAYSGVLKTLLAAKQAAARQDHAGQADFDRPKLFMESLQFIAESLKELDPEGLKILAGSFDAIVQRFKAQHEKTA